MNKLAMQQKENPGLLKTAVILAAGVGSRLYPLTQNKPKCMVSVAGQPILEYQLQAYEKAGFDKVYIVGGFRIDLIKAWLAVRPGRIAVEIIENRDFAVTNNMFSLFLLRDKLQGRPFYLSNGDVVFDPSVLRMLEESDPRDSAIAIDSSVFHEEAMKVALDAAAHPCGISKRYAASEAAAVSIDVYRFSAEGAQSLFHMMHETIVQHRERNQWTELALDAVLKLQGHRFRLIDIAGLPWVEIDNHDDLAQADFLFCPTRAKIAGAKAFVFDIDGTLAIDGKFLPEAVDIVKKLRRQKKVFFCTNNSSRSRAEYAEFLRSGGVSCRTEDVISSIGATTAYLRSRSIHSVFLLGMPSLERELEASGIVCVKDRPDLVVVGFDKSLNYETLARASQLIAQGCPYILTHPDVSCPTSSGPIPDAGAIGAMLEAATGVKPIAVLGKPSPVMLQSLFTEHHLRPDQIVVVGDRLTTDIKMAEEAGCFSILVLSGATSRLEADDSAIKPTLIMKSVAGIDGLPSQNIQRFVGKTYGFWTAHKGYLEPSLATRAVDPPSRIPLPLASDFVTPVLPARHLLS